MLGAGLVAWALLSTVLAFATPLGFFNAVFLPFLLVGMPVLSWAQLPLLEKVALERTTAYMSSVGAIVTIGSISLLLGLRTFGAEAMGLGPLPGGAMVAWTTGLLLAAAVLIGGFWIGGRIFEVSESPILRQLLPKTGAERGVFAILSLAAGVGEELAYRAYAILAVGVLVTPPWLALTVATLPFGLVHAYQGVVGLVRTYLLGLVLGASFLATGSIWPAMIAHTLLDLIGGLILGERLVGRATEAPIHAKG